MDEIDKKLLDALQADFPLAERPFLELGERFGIGEREVIERVVRLKNDGVIRQISAIFDSRMLGYASVLAAFATDDSRLDDVGNLLAADPRISHCYSRANEFNLWFTLTVAPGEDIDEIISSYASRVGVSNYMILPALKVYKIGVFFKMGDGEGGALRTSTADYKPVELDADAKNAVRALQRDIELTERPFGQPAREIGMDTGELLARARELLSSGAMRRFGAVLRHGKTNYKTNAMVCWRFSDQEVDSAGEALAARPFVSHCYRRPAHQGWPYELYAMTHFQSDEEMEMALAGLEREFPGNEHVILRTMKEYRKSRVKYFM